MPDSVVFALGHPLRLRALCLLEIKAQTSRELADDLAINLTTLRYHVQTLAEAGLIIEVAQRQRRGFTASVYQPRKPGWIKYTRALQRLTDDTDDC